MTGEGGYDDLRRRLLATVSEGLAPYRARLHTRGAKVGTSIHAHLVGGAERVLRLAPLLGLPVEEAALLAGAFAVHDLNKLDGGEGRAFRALADDRAFVDRTLTEARIDELLAPTGGVASWRADLLELVRLHSGHYAVSGGLLAPALDRTRLGLRRLGVLRHVLMAVDVLDLSTSWGEKVHKDTFLHHVNVVRNAQGLRRLRLDRRPGRGLDGPEAIVAYREGALALVPEDEP